MSRWVPIKLCLNTGTFSPSVRMFSYLDVYWLTGASCHVMSVTNQFIQNSPRHNRSFLYLHAFLLHGCGINALMPLKTCLQRHHSV